jgi:RNA polymerase sigma-70 factor (ECF subfamily)
MLMFDPSDLASRPAYFVLLDWIDDRVAAIRHFHFARFAIEGAELHMLGEPGGEAPNSGLPQ